MNVSEKLPKRIKEAFSCFWELGSVQKQGQFVPPEKGYYCLFVDGNYKCSSLPDGIELFSLEEAAGARPAWGKRIETSFSELNTRLSSGVLLYVPDGLENVEFQIVHWATGVGLCSPRCVVVLGCYARVQIAANYYSSSSVSATNGVTELYVSQGAHLDLHICARYADETRLSWSHFASVDTKGSCSIVCTLSETSGYGFFSNALALKGEEAKGTIDVRAMEVDKTWVHHSVWHEAPSTRSDQRIKTVLSSGYFSFEGSIHISPKGVLSYAYQKHDTLLLGDLAQVETFPRLDILADDVKASHGATVGPIDPLQLFYLRSRGLSAREATHSVVEGFLKE